MKYGLALPVGGVCGDPRVLAGLVPFQGNRDDTGDVGLDGQGSRLELFGEPAMGDEQNADHVRREILGRKG